jgi:hypothetical protein
MEKKRIVQQKVRQAMRLEQEERTIVRINANNRRSLVKESGANGNCSRKE